MKLRSFYGSIPCGNIGKKNDGRSEQMNIYTDPMGLTVSILSPQKHSHVLWFLSVKFIPN